MGDRVSRPPESSDSTSFNYSVCCCALDIIVLILLDQKVPVPPIKKKVCWWHNIHKRGT
jgi:hypothetical protein